MSLSIKLPSSEDLVARALAQSNEIYLNLIREELQRLHEQYQERDRSYFQSLAQRFYRSFFNNYMDQSNQRNRLLGFNSRTIYMPINNGYHE